MTDVGISVTLTAVPITHMPVIPEHFGPLGALEKKLRPDPQTGLK